MSSNFWENDASPVSQDSASSSGDFWEHDASPVAPKEASTGPSNGQNALNTLNATGSQIGRNIPIVGPAAVKAGLLAQAAEIRHLLPDSKVPPEFKGKTVGEIYDALVAKDHEQQAASEDTAKDVKEHNIASTVGSIAGSVAAPVPGAGVEGALGIGTRIAGNAAVAAADTAVREGSLDNVSKSAGIAGGITGAIEAIPVVGKVAGLAAKKAVNAFSGVGEGTIDRYLSSPAAREAINNAPNIVDQTKKLVTHLDNNASELSRDSSASFKILKDSGIRADASDFIKPLEDGISHIDSVGNYGPERKATVGFFNKLSKDIAEDAANNGGTLSLDKGKALLNVLDSKIEAASNKGGDAQVIKSLTDARKGVDSFLKQSVPEYAEHMAELSSNTENLKGIADKFRSDTGAMNTLKRIQSGKDPFSAEALEKYDSAQGTNFKQELQNAYDKSAFSRDTTNGSRKAVTGTVIGSAIGHYSGIPGGNYLGGTLGAVVGGLADKYGGEAVKLALDTGINVSKLAGTKYVQPIMEAAKRGNKALAVTHYLLSQQDPAYQKLQQEQQ